MEYVTVKCPYCGQILGQMVNPVKTVASPFEQCRYCEKIYVNYYKEEWITKSPLKRFFFFLQSGTWCRAIMLPMVVWGPLLGGFAGSVELMLAAWGVSFVLWLVIAYFLRKKAAEDSIVASIVRTQDEKYVQMLKNFGFKIYPINVSDNETNELLSAINDFNKAKKYNETVKDKYVNDPDYGLVKEKPIYVNGVTASKEYLSQLLTENGELLKWDRLGSMAVDGIQGMIDRYNLYLPSGELYKTVYINIYCLSNSESIPQGFVKKS